MEKFEVEVDVEEVYYFRATGLPGHCAQTLNGMYRRTYDEAKRDGMLAMAADKCNAFTINRTFVKVNERNEDDDPMIFTARSEYDKTELVELFDNPKS